MEAVAAAASVAGIITVVGQSIDGLVKFSDFFSDVSSASKTISRLLSDIDSLIQVLYNIGEVLEQAEARRLGQNFALLDVKLEDCAKDVQIWLATARVLRPASNGGGKAWLQKFRLAVNNTAIQTIRDEIGRHKQTLCLSLAVFGRTIDIDTADQVHRIGGRFDEAFSSSLSIHGAHEEALRRIEHYSITSMHSSAHSVRSMDSIRTELSRLEAMITSASATHPTETETVNIGVRPGSSSTEKESSTIAQGGDWGPRPSMSVPLPEHSGESSTGRESGIELSPGQDSLPGTQNSVDRYGHSHGTKETVVEHYVEPDYNISSADSHAFMDESENSNNRSLDDFSEKENKSSFLYAEFSKKALPRRHASHGIDIDHGTIPHLLGQSLASIYPPEVVEYISLQQLTILCENHINLLDKRPSVQISTTAKMKEREYMDGGPPGSARPFLITLGDQLIVLRNAIKVCREKCVKAGYSLSELDELLIPTGSGSRAPADRPPPVPEADSGDDSSSVYSEDFHSTTE